MKQTREVKDVNPDDDCTIATEKKKKKKPSTLLVVFAIVMFIGLQIGSLYFIFAKAAGRGYVWQLSLFRIALWEELLNIFFIETMQVLIFYVSLTGLLFDALQGVYLREKTSSVLCAVRDRVDKSQSIHSRRRNASIVRPETNRLEEMRLPVHVQDSGNCQAVSSQLISQDVDLHLSNHNELVNVTNSYRVKRYVVSVVSLCHPVVIQSVIYLVCILLAAFLMYVYYAYVSGSTVGESLFVGILGVCVVILMCLHIWESKRDRLSTLTQQCEDAAADDALIADNNRDDSDDHSLTNMSSNISISSDSENLSDWELSSDDGENDDESKSLSNCSIEDASLSIHSTSNHINEEVDVRSEEVSYP